MCVCLSITVSGSAQSWVEIAFGTRSGVVRVIVQHPENVGQGLQVFRTFVAHTSPVIKVVLGEKHLITGENSVSVFPITALCYCAWAIHLVIACTM